MRREIAPGTRFGKLVVLRPLPMRGVRSEVEVECDCGTRRAVYTTYLLKGNNRACGCMMRTHMRKHGHSVGRPTPEFTAWNAAKRRCYNPRFRDFKDYGGRGITVCERWRDDFSAFFSDMGARPSPKHSLDRIDVDGDYSPSNCRWATKLEQSENRRCTRMSIHDAIDVRSLCGMGVAREALAHEYGVSCAYIGKIVRGEVWS